MGYYDEIKKMKKWIQVALTENKKTALDLRKLKFNALQQFAVSSKAFDSFIAELEELKIIEVKDGTIREKKKE